MKMLINDSPSSSSSVSTAPPSQRLSSSTWPSSAAPRCSTSMETTLSSALLSPECTESACFACGTLAIRTSLPPSSTEWQRAPYVSLTNTSAHVLAVQLARDGQIARDAPHFTSSMDTLVRLLTFSAKTFAPLSKPVSISMHINLYFCPLVDTICSRLNLQ